MYKLVVIGLGYVGLALAHESVLSGHEVTGLDVSSVVVDSLNAGRSHIDDISDEDVRDMLARGFRASTDPAVIAQADTTIICVPTPLSLDGAPDLRAIESAGRAIAQNLTPGLTVVLESTTYPGTTDTVLKGILDAAGYEIDKDYHLAFSPERIDPGNPSFGLRNTPKVVGGVTPASGEAAVAFYSTVVDTVVKAVGAREAETAKLLENSYRHINIALVNEMSKFCHELRIDFWDVIEAAKTKPFGFQAFYPGPGVGGHCIPIDPNYLSYEVKRTLGYPFRFVELAQEVNQSMGPYVVTRVQDILNDDSLALKNSRVLILGVTYKADISDQRESPAVPIAEKLLSKGALVSFHDPNVASWKIDGGPLQRVEDLDAAVAEADLVLLLQNHSMYDVPSLAESSARFFDTRGVLPSGSRGHRL